MSEFLDELARTLAKPMPRSRVIRVLGGSILAAAFPLARPGLRTASAAQPPPVTCASPGVCSNPFPKVCGCNRLAPLQGCHRDCCDPKTQHCCKWDRAGDPPCDHICCPIGTDCGSGEPGDVCVPRCPTRCGEKCCKKGEYCADPRRSLCCANGETKCQVLPTAGSGPATGKEPAMCCPSTTPKCVANDKRMACCKPADSPCAGRCCPPDKQCTNGVCACPKGSKTCGRTCCDKAETCCSEKVCCKTKTQTCCGQECCDAKTQKCCGGTNCCKKEQSCCGEECCDKGEKCCGGTKCCKQDQTCCGEKCCDKGEKCCHEETCCKSTEICMATSQRTVQARSSRSSRSVIRHICCPKTRVLGTTGCCPPGTVANAGSRRCCPSGNPDCCGEDASGVACLPPTICVSGTCTRL